MTRFLFLLQKEFIQILRNRFMLPIIFVVPFVQLILLSYAANYEVKNIRIAVVDHPRSPMSRDLMHHFKASTNFQHQQSYPSPQRARESLDNGSADMILVIPHDFQTAFFEDGSSPQLQLIFDAINGSKAGVAAG